LLSIDWAISSIEAIPDEATISRIREVDLSRIERYSRGLHPIVFRRKRDRYLASLDREIGGFEERLAHRKRLRETVASTEPELQTAITGCAPSSLGRAYKT